MNKNGQDVEASTIEQHKIKRLIKRLEAAHGAGTSMISLVIKQKDDINRISKMLVEEQGTASNIKSRVNRLSVLSAITSTLQRLKLYRQTPPNGLVIYCGTILNEEGKEKKVNIDFEPFKPINTSLYLCDNKFHVEALNELLVNDDKYGFIVMDGGGSLFGTVQGNVRTIISRFSVDLPKKHGRGGQSAMRFARIRLEKRHHYIRKVAEQATSVFISNDTINVKGLILAGSAEFKNELSGSALFDPRLRSQVMKIVDVAYGGENGFSQAIELCSDFLANVKFVQEKKVITKYMEEVSMDTGKYCFGVTDTIMALESGACETTIIWENIRIERVQLRNNITGQESVVWLNPEQAKEASWYKDNETGQDLEVMERLELCDWLLDNYENFGTTVELITDQSQEGSQFVRGFGGFGGILRYKLDFDCLPDEEFSDSLDFI